MSVAAVVTAAGYGTRLGSTIPKALVSVGQRPLLVWALEHLAPLVDHAVVTAPPTHMSDVESAVRDFADDLGGLSVRIVAGGETRQESVALALDALFDGTAPIPDIIMVHDAARAFMPTEVMKGAIEAVRGGAHAAVPVVPVVDTLVHAPEGERTMGGAVDRASVRAVQTPQVFTAQALKDAHEKSIGSDATDDASLARESGYRVVTVDGHRWGFKITHEDDLPFAEHVASRRRDTL